MFHVPAWLSLLQGPKDMIHRKCCMAVVVSWSKLPCIPGNMFDTSQNNIEYAGI